MNATLLLTTYNRNELLHYTLESIKSQATDVEVVVINDYLPDASVTLAKKYGARYMFTGQRNMDSIVWRCPGFAINYAVKRTQSDIIIISCAEVYQMGSCLEQLLAVGGQHLAIPTGIDDTGNHLQALQNHCPLPLEGPPLNTRLPFLMAVPRETFVEIGGYDEDFTGQGYDDNDLVERLQAAGCRYVETEARCIHLYHSRNLATRGTGRLAYNRKLFESRRGTIRRNTDKEWGNG